MRSIIIPETYKYMSAFLTMRCNLKCSYCLNTLNNEGDFKRTKFMEISGEKWVNALNRIESRLDLPITFTGGEPFLHKDFVYIINSLKHDLNIDVLTNLCFDDRRIDKFISEVDPQRIKRDSPYASIRVSYHPEQIGRGEKLVENVKKFQDAGFSIGMYYVAYPGTRESELVTQMQFRCLDAEIDFRRKDFTGKYKGELYGDYSKHPNSILQEKTFPVLCRTSELLMGPNAGVYRCHRDLYHEEFSVGNLTNPSFEIQDVFRKCDLYGRCDPCDVKVKTNYKQRLEHTSVEVKNISKN